MKQKIDYRIVIAGIAGLVALNLGAMFNGIDGKLLTIVVGIIALAIGVSIPQVKFK